MKRSDETDVKQVKQPALESIISALYGPSVSRFSDPVKRPETPETDPISPPPYIPPIKEEVLKSSLLTVSVVNNERDKEEAFAGGPRRAYAFRLPPDGPSTTASAVGGEASPFGRVSTHPMASWHPRYARAVCAADHLSDIEIAAMEQRYHAAFVACDERDLESVIEALRPPRKYFPAHTKASGRDLAAGKD